MRGRLQHASGFSNALILAAIRTECTRVILCWKKLADQLARVDWLPEGKGCCWVASVAFQNLSHVLVSTELQRHVWVKETAASSVASLKQLPIASSDFRAITLVFERQY